MSAPAPRAAPRSTTVEEFRQWPWLPAILQPHAIYQSEGGECVRLDEAGHVAPWPANSPASRRPR